MPHSTAAHRSGFRETYTDFRERCRTPCPEGDLPPGSIRRETNLTAYTPLWTPLREDCALTGIGSGVRLENRPIAGDPEVVQPATVKAFEARSSEIRASRKCDEMTPDGLKAAGRACRAGTRH